MKQTFLRWHGLGFTHVYLVRFSYSFALLSFVLLYVYGAGNYTRLSDRALLIVLYAAGASGFFTLCVAVPALLLSIFKKIHGSSFSRRVFFFLPLSILAGALSFSVSGLLRALISGLQF